MTFDPTRETWTVRGQHIYVETHPVNWIGMFESDTGIDPNDTTDPDASPTLENSEARARLAAAAPDMARVLKDFTAADVERILDAPYGVALGTLADADDALRKAGAR